MKDMWSWLGRCLLRDEASGETMQALAAVLAEQREDFGPGLRTLLTGRGLELLSIQDVHIAAEWIARFPRERAEATALARAVSDLRPAILGTLRPDAMQVATLDGRPGADAHGPGADNLHAWLTVEDIEGGEPLDAQFGMMDKLTVPEALRAAVFGQPQSGGEALAFGTYALLDAAKLPLLPGRLEDSGLPFCCLFQGDAGEDLANVAPYLVELADGDAFTRSLFTRTGRAADIWDREAGIVIRSSASLDELRRHFRRFTRIQDEDGKWFYFRFWDELRRADREADAPWLVRLFCRPGDRFITMGGQPLRRLELDARAKPPAGPIVLTTEWKERLAIAHQAKYARGLLERDYPALSRTLNGDLQREWSEHMARRFRHHGLQTSFSKETYVQMAVLLGTRFDEDITLPAAATILREDAPCYLRMIYLKTAVFEGKDQIYGDRLQHYTRALERIAAQDEDRVFAAVNGDKPLDAVLQLFPEKARALSHDQLSALAAQCNTVSAVFAADERRAGAVMVFTHAFILGSGSLDDPLHDYLRKLLHDDEPEKARRLFRYGQKRARAQLRAMERLTNNGSEGER